MIHSINYFICKMVRYVIFIFLSCLTASLALNAQIVSGELPPSLNTLQKAQLVSETLLSEKLIVQKPNISALLEEDEAEKDLGKAWRFGHVIDSSFSLKNSGHWQHFANGKSRWSLMIIAPEAKSINLNFDQFKLSRSAKLFAYNPKENDFLGALTKVNNTADGKMAIRPIQGALLQLELWVNTAEVNQNYLSCKQVVYGYKDLFNKTAKAFGNSGNCNININCKEGNPWQDVKRSVVMSLTNSNSRLCTGTLLNNTAQDSTPYVLTANHCGNTAAIFVFNYESAACTPNTDGSLAHSIYGARLRARNFSSDFILYELDTIPPAAYNAYYAGWSALPNPAQYATCIHHPSGDVKKVSIGKGAVESEIYNNVGSVENHWRVNSWLKGTTEPGSSGAPLFNENQRVVGQLHGGTASCTQLDGSDSFGKFAQSWNANTDTSQSLYYWLDPINSNQLFIDGLDPNGAQNSLDLALLYTYNLNTYACQNESYSLAIKNKGSLPIDSFSLYIINGNIISDSITRIQTLNQNETAVLTLSASNLSFGQNDLQFVIYKVNGTNDLNQSNDTLRQSIFFNTTPINLYLEIKTDDYGDETTWEVSANNVVPPLKLFEGGPYEDVVGGKIYRDTLCFFDSCFTFNLYDSFGDGFNGSFGNGYLLLTDGLGDTLIHENSFLSSQESYQFCLDDTSTTLIEKKGLAKNLQLYPNPIKRGNQLKWTDQEGSSINQDVEIYNLNGQLVSQFNRTNHLVIPNEFTPGIYLIMIKGAQQTEWSYKKKLIVY